MTRSSKNDVEVASPKPSGDTITLRYTGGGYGGALVGVPARDLTETDIVALAAASVATRASLKASGLYEPAGAPTVRSEE